MKKSWKSTRKKTAEGAQIIHDFIIDETILPEIREVYVKEIQGVLKPELPFSPDEDVPFELVEKIPLLPGCSADESGNQKTECFLRELNQHMSSSFDTDIANYAAEMTTTIDVKFIIGKNEIVKDNITITNIAQVL